jgi:MinD superfamily P-loop ATPase
MKVAISSGKGGTGKTFLATNLAAVAAEAGADVTYFDCDVEEPNGHLFLKPARVKRKRMTVRAPLRIDPDKCTACGQCVRACRYNALALIKGKTLLFPELCHACGVCSLVCPEGAVIEGDKEIGELRHGTSGKIAFHDGVLKTGVGGMSPRLIRGLKRHAGEGLTLLDSPPGTACATVETLKDADLCVLVADPTPFALHDLKLSVNMCRAIGQEPAVVVNRAGLDDAALQAYVRRAALEVLAEIPDDRRVAEIYSVGDLAIEKLPEYRAHFRRLLDRVRDVARRERPVRKDLIEPLFQPGGTTERAKAPSDAPRPQEIVVISGKGGTGKTSIAACFAQLGKGSVVSDCDVDASDLHLVLNPQIEREGDFVGGMAVEIDEAACVRCGRCTEACRFAAIRATAEGGYAIDPAACEGCGACEVACPVGAISSRDEVNGKWFVSTTRFGPMSHAFLGYAEENSGRLVTLVRDLAADLAAQSESGRSAGEAPPRVTIDGSPGTGCPVIVSVTGAHYAFVVTEPTVSGLHDLLRVFDLTRHFRVPAGVIVNKADLNPEMTRRIEEAAREADADLLGAIPYDNAFTQAQIRRRTLLEHGSTPASDAVRTAWGRLCDRIAAAAAP